MGTYPLLQLLTSSLAAMAGMVNTDGLNIDLYIPRKWFVRRNCACIHGPCSAHRWRVACSSATNRLIQAKDKASVQLNIGHVKADGALDRLWTKVYEDAKGAI